MQRISPVVLEKQKINALNVISPFRHYLYLDKGVNSTFQNFILYTQGGIEPSLVEIGPVILEKEDF